MEHKKVKIRLLANWHHKGTEYLAGEVLLLEEPIARQLYENDIAQLIFGFGFDFGNDPRRDREKVLLEHIAKMNELKQWEKTTGFPY